MSPASIAALAAEIARRTDVAIAVHDIDGPSRQAHRDAGLMAVAAALRATGCTEVPSGHHDDGRPRWPKNRTGSITHAGDIAVAAAITCDARRVVGVDVERAEALAATDAEAVLDDDERALVARATNGNELATRLWSAKEAAFKAWSEATGGGLGTVDPADIHVDFGAPEGGLCVVHARARHPLAAATAPVGALTGWMGTAAGYELVVMVGVVS
jgi:phosphopantetheinyl transferase